MKPSIQARQQPQGGFKFHDILYIFFKHKWKIILLTLVGFGAAGFIGYKNWATPSYETRASLLVRYVVERNATDPEAPDGLRGGTTYMNTELEILGSTDLAIAAAERIGPQKLLPKADKPTAVDAAQHLIAGFKVEIGQDSNVIHLSYRDESPDLAVKALSEIIQTYFSRHLEIHRSAAAFDQVTVQTDQARSTLRTTEEEINRLKSQSGVLNIKTTIEEFEGRRQNTGAALQEAQAALAAQRGKVEAMEKSLASRPRDAADNDGKPAAAATPKKPEEETSKREISEALSESKDLSERLTMLRQQRNQTLLRRPASDPMVVSLDEQIASVQRKSLDLTERYPEISKELKASGQAAGSNSATTLADERALLDSLDARVKEISNQSKAIESQVESLSALGFKLDGLERRRQMEDDKYRYLETSLEKARVDETLDPSKIPNISIVQNPSAPVKSIDSKTMKLIMGIASSGLVAGLAIAFLIEKVLDRRVSRPVDIQMRLQLPLMMSIPYIRSKDRVLKRIGRETEVELLGNSTDPLSPPPLPNEKLAVNGSSGVKVTRSAEEDFIAPFAGAIHDRIVFNFQVNNINHKPKLVALTGLSEGAGTSTIAAGLAKAFSENANRKVLLVDLNPSMRGVQLHGHPADSLFRALEVSKAPQFRKSTKSLYFASAPTRRNGADSSLALAPAGLHEIMPHLVTSDFDYIIFDLPPVAPTSPTLVMAGFMDKVLLVLDADNTTPDNLNWAYSELESSRADVSCIFNKARSHAPRWVQGEI